MANTGQLAEALLSRFEIPSGIRASACRETFSSGITDIDRLLQGGFPRAALSEIAGPASTNRTALMVTTLARAFDTGECGAWIDGGGTFDPESAAEAGLQLDRLLWINCKGNPEHALKATDLLLHGGGFGVMVFDVGDISDRVLRAHANGIVVPPKARSGKDGYCPDSFDSRSADALVFSRMRRA